MKKKKGFTLIELLAVIVILAIIALIATLERIHIYGLFFIVLGQFFQIAGYSSLSFNTVAMHSISISQPGRQTEAQRNTFG